MSNKRFMTIVFFLSCSIAFWPSARAQQAPTVAAPEETREETLLSQVATLQLQMAQTLDKLAGCEKSGAQSAQYQQAGQATVQILVKSLAARNLMLDSSGNVVAMPPKPTPTPAPAAPKVEK